MRRKTSAAAERFPVQPELILQIPAVRAVFRIRQCQAAICEAARQSLTSIGRVSFACALQPYRNRCFQPPRAGPLCQPGRGRRWLARPVLSRPPFGLQVRIFRDRVDCSSRWRGPKPQLIVLGGGDLGHQAVSAPPSCRSRTRRVQEQADSRRRQAAVPGWNGFLHPLLSSARQSPWRGLFRRLPVRV